MKIATAIVVGMLAASDASAQFGILGMLVNSRSTTSVTGKLIWECTYRVNNQLQTVLLDHICPPTMQFQ